MLKIRLQGTKNDIRWFLKILKRDKRLDVENTSTFFSNNGTDKYKRLYTEVYRKDKQSNREQKNEHAKREKKYQHYGSGARFS